MDLEICYYVAGGVMEGPEAMGYPGYGGHDAYGYGRPVYDGKRLRSASRPRPPTTYFVGSTDVLLFYADGWDFEMSEPTAPDVSSWGRGGQRLRMGLGLWLGRKPPVRKVVDFNPGVIRYLERRLFFKDPGWHTRTIQVVMAQLVMAAAGYSSKIKARHTRTIRNTKALSAVIGSWLAGRRC